MKGAGTKTDNHPQARAAKITIRQKVLEAIGKDVAVFDAFAGSGEMFSAVWKQAKAYTGCDLKPQRDSRLMFCADNTRVLRAIDLAKFSIFDFDAYGSPWVQAIILSDRRRVAPGERIGLILTEGAGLGYKFNNVPGAISLLTGLRRGHGRHRQAPRRHHRARHRRPLPAHVQHGRKAVAGRSKWRRRDPLHRPGAQGEGLAQSRLRPSQPCPGFLQVARGIG